MPDESEVFGLLALMLLHDSRARRASAGGELVLLADQDRSLWDRAQIGAGRAALERALALRGRGPYVLQAAIAALHAERSHATGRRSSRSTTELARADALAGRRAEPRGRDRRGRGPRPGLASIDRLELDELPATCTSTRAELLRRLGRDRPRRASLPARARS